MSGVTCNLLVKKLVSLLQKLISNFIIKSSVVDGGQLLSYNNMCT